MSKDLRGAIQWQQNDNMFAAAGTTSPALPSGVYKPLASQNGFFFQLQSMKTDELVVLPDTATQAIVLNIRKFWTAKQVFKRLKMIHKRGALLHGPPGSGKTATVELLCQDVLGLNGIVLMSREPGVLSFGLQVIRRIEPDRPIVVILEDLEEIIKPRGAENLVLDLLDGESQIENVVFLATTNHFEDLPDRLVNRPSRFDEVVFVGMPSEAARSAYIRSRVPIDLLDDTELKRWVGDTPGLSIAHLKELIVAAIALDRPYKEVLGRLHKMAAPNSDDPVAASKTNYSLYSSSLGGDSAITPEDIQSWIQDATEASQ